MFSKSAAYLHTPPPAMLAHNPLSYAEDDDDDDDEDDDNDYDYGSDESEDDDYNHRTGSSGYRVRKPQRRYEDRDEGVFVSD